MGPAEPKRGGRPPRVDLAGTATRERLLAAAVAACVEHGFEGATVADIAQRADVSGPALYKHFGGKDELMVAAGRAALGRLTVPSGSETSGTGRTESGPSGSGPTGSGGSGRRRRAREVAHTFLADDFAETRVLLSELHLAGQRHPAVAELLAAWHRENAPRWLAPARGPNRTAVVKTFFLLLLGLCQIDALAALDPPPRSVRARVDALVDALFAEGASW